MYPNISFFDSGQGGLTIWENVIKHFPNMNTLYLGDNARCPYGNKSPETITRYSQQAGLFLEAQNAKMLVIACGTASSVATEHLQNKLHIPVIGIVESLCQYIQNLLPDKTQSVAVLATRYTIRSQKFQTQLHSYGIENVWARACPLFVPIIEEGISEGEIVRHACALYLNDIPKNIKVVVLACTHYPRIVKAIAQYLTEITGRSVFLKALKEDVQLTQSTLSCQNDDPIFLVEPSIPIIQKLSKFFTVGENQVGHHGQHRIFCTDSPTQFAHVANYFTQLELPTVELVEISQDK